MPMLAVLGRDSVRGRHIHLLLPHEPSPLLTSQMNVRKASIMRVFAVCEDSGAIQSILVMSDGGVRPSVNPSREGLTELEVALPELTENLDDHEVHQQLVDLVENARVDLEKRTFVAR